MKPNPNLKTLKLAASPWPSPEEIASAMLLAASQRLELPRVDVRADYQWFATVEAL